MVEEDGEWVVCHEHETEWGCAPVVVIANMFFCDGFWSVEELAMDVVATNLTGENKYEDLLGHEPQGR